MVYYTELYVDSCRYNYGTNNQFTILLDRALASVKNSKYIKAQIPRTFYGVNSFNNSFVFQEEVGVAFTASVSAGNYTIAEFLTALKTAMDIASTNGRVYTLTHSSITNKITISINAGTFSVLGANASSTGHLLIGFDAVSTAQATPQTGSLVERITTFPEEIYIRGTLGQNTYFSQVDNNSVSNNILVKVDTQGAPRNTYILDTNQQEDLFNTDTNIDTIESYCTYNDINTHTPRIVDFNGANWSYVVGLYNKID
jgi:hypothetical protein